MKNKKQEYPNTGIACPTDVYKRLKKLSNETGVKCCVVTGWALTQWLDKNEASVRKTMDGTK